MAGSDAAAEAAAAAAIAPYGAPYGLVVVGASWGGLNALSRLLADLPADLAAPVAFVQHRSKESDHVLAQLLQDRSSLRV